MMFFIGILIPYIYRLSLPLLALFAHPSQLLLTMKKSPPSTVHIINASAGNSLLYVASRTILFMARSAAVGYTAFLNPSSAKDLVINYILLPVSVLFFVVNRFWKKTKWVRLEDIDIYTGRKEVVIPGSDGKSKDSWWKKVNRKLIR